MTNKSELEKKHEETRRFWKEFRVEKSKAELENMSKEELKTYIADCYRDDPFETTWRTEKYSELCREVLASK